MSDISALLVLPHLRVQNANAISSPLTWGFPSMTSFIGFMQALERKLSPSLAIEFSGIGVICHSFEPQTTDGGFTKAFRLTRNPVAKDGSTAAIVEEGRAHLEITLVLAVAGEKVLAQYDPNAIAETVGEVAASMRIAGGSIMVPPPGRSRRRHHPELVVLSQDDEKRATQFKRLSRRWLPGFALVSRDDLLVSRLAEMRENEPAATVLDAWLDLSSLNIACTPSSEQGDAGDEKAEWKVRRPDGWVVPIPVGYAALSDLHSPGEVRSARDPSLPFRFVESLYSIGQWISPHRLGCPEELFWFVDNDIEAGLYRVRNDYQPINV